MLIYNFQKEFLGIDEKDLVALGYKNLSELKSEVSDFADLFVKTPGYIHNFKHVHWIDFITCSESYEESKVIINVNNKNYKSTITISTAFLVENPSEKAYIVTLNNLRELTHQENEAVANDVIERPINNFKEETKRILDEPKDVESPNITIDPYETPLKEKEEIKDFSHIDEIKIDINMDDEDLIIQDDFVKDDFVDEIVQPVESIEKEIIQESFDNGYTYNPSVASEELGLPLDLIEEFIQDFITQAKEFKKKLYIALDEADLNNIKILSHKLKGVAANLRVEDALETLTTANTSSDLNIIKENLDTFYNIISKLAGEEISVEKTIIPEQNDDDDELLLDFKNTTEDEDDLYSDPIEIIKPSTIKKVEEDFLLEIPNSNETVEIEIQDDTTSIKEISEVINYSKETIANEIGIDTNSFNNLFQDYLEDSKVILESIKKALADENSEIYQAEGLKLKGMSDNMRINSFTNELETIIYSSDTNTKSIAEAVDTIQANIAQLSNLEV